MAKLAKIFLLAKISVYTVSTCRYSSTSEAIKFDMFIPVRLVIECKQKERWDSYCTLPVAISQWLVDTGHVLPHVWVERLIAQSAVWSNSRSWALSIEAVPDVDNCSSQSRSHPTLAISQSFRTTIVSTVYKRQPVALNPIQSRQLQLLLCQWFELLLGTRSSLYDQYREVHVTKEQ